MRCLTLILNKNVDLAMQNIIANVTRPDSISHQNNNINKNRNIKAKADSKNKIISNKSKIKNNEEKPNNKDNQENNKDNNKIEVTMLKQYIL